MAASSSSSRKRSVEEAFGDIEALPERERETPLAPPQLYDVFISHRGPDVKHTLASQLYASLQKRGCRAFLDKEEIKGGDSISSTIHNAICSSSVQIAIFSRGYAESKWCLDELLLMLQQTNAFFIPVFYQVEPWELRYIDHKGAYAEAFSDYNSKGRNLNKLDDWKSALSRASDINGYKFSEHGPGLCDKIVSDVVNRIEARRPLKVAEYPVGMDESVRDFETHCRDRVQEIIKGVGIFGLGGSGKTTLAKELFNRERSKYNASCFLNDVRETYAKGELHSMQTKLLKDLFNEDHKFYNGDEGTTYLRDRLGNANHLRFLIVLDDIDHHDQLDALLFKDMQSRGNLVIVTTRDQRVLIRGQIGVHYSMKVLDMPRATELFCSHAFLQPYPDIGYHDLVASFVKLCGGLPLSLKVLGAQVRGSNDRNYWESVLGKVENTLPEDIIQRLKISFDSLDGDEKQIFMDIACFFIGKEKDRAMKIWKGSGWSAEHALQTLRDRNLVEVEVEVGVGVEAAWFPPPTWIDLQAAEGCTESKEIVFRMHDHLRDLGRRMSQELRPPRLWQPHHLRSMESEGFRKILAETNGRCFHKFWYSSIHCYITYFIGNTNDCTETSTVLLWLELQSQRKFHPKIYQIDTYEGILSWLPLEKLQGLRVRDLHRPLLDRYFQIQKRIVKQVNIELKELEFIWCNLPPNLLNLLGICNHLENLVLDGVEMEIGTSFSQSLRKLGNLRRLVLGSRLTGELVLSNNTDSTHSDSSTSTCMNSVKTIIIKRGYLSKLLISGEICPSLQSLRVLVDINLIEMDLKLVTTLKELRLSECDKLKTISGLSDLVELVTLIIEDIPELEELPTLAHLTCLESIVITGAWHRMQSIAGIEELEGLKRLHLEGVKGRGGVWNCMYGLKRLPSELTIVTCIGAHKSSLNANLFLDANSVNEILWSGSDFDDELDLGVSKLKMAGSMSALILCLWFRCPTGYYELIETPGHVRLKITKGEGMVTIVITDKRQIDHYVRCPYRLHCSAKIEKGYVVNVREGEEWRTLQIFKRIIGEVCIPLTD